MTRPRPRPRRLARVALLALALLLLPAAPAAAVTVGASYRPPQVLLHFDRQETRRIAAAAHTGFTPFVSSLCLLVPGGRRLVVLAMGCTTGMSLGYGRLAPIFKDAARRGRCVRVSFPVGVPVPNPAPYSRAQGCS